MRRINLEKIKSVEDKERKEKKEGKVIEKVGKRIGINFIMLKKMEKKEGVKRKE